MVRKKCNGANCRTYVDVKVGFCERCRPRETQHYDRSRPADHVRFYNSAAWKKMRLAVLMKQPLCVRCLEDGVIERAIVCDHKIPIRVWWEGRLVLDNIQGLCRDCDNKKRAEEHKRYGKGRKELD